jgi:lipoate-protein ligase B
MARELEVAWLGRVPYAEALALQERRLEAVRGGAAPDALLLLEHAPVVTLGRSAKPEHLCVSPDELAERGVELHAVARGGDVTFHGPGQLVGYPIVDLAARGRPDVHRFLRDLEGALVDALAELGVAAQTLAGLTGVFVKNADPPRKLASIGVGLRGWVTWHGFALNVGEDLAGFDAIVPCGLRGVAMTSVARELGDAAPPDLWERARTAVAAAVERRLA